MKKHGFISASAGFWYILRLAASYYLIVSLSGPTLSEADKLLYLWFGSPALVVAAIFFFQYFRPGRYPGLHSLGRLALGLGIAVSLFTAGAILFYNLTRFGLAMDRNMLGLAFGFLGLSVLVDLLFLILTRHGRDDTAEVS